VAKRDLRPTIYLVLDQIFVIIYAYVVVAVIPNRLPSAKIHLYTLPIFMQGLAIGMALRYLRNDRLTRIGWWIGVVSGSLMLLTTILLIIRVLVSAAFLAGVYGAFGKAAAMVALVPIFQVKYLMTRAGRRAFSLPT
jgi:hypothetical protein